MDNEKIVKLGLAKIDIGLLAPFQTFFSIVIDSWHNGTPRIVPESLGQNFQDDLLSGISENMYSTNQTCLSFDQKMMKCFVLDLYCAANISESQIELHTKTCNNQVQQVTFILNVKAVTL